jgi:hypothetical protein
MSRPTHAGKVRTRLLQEILQPQESEPSIERCRTSRNLCQNRNTCAIVAANGQKHHPRPLLRPTFDSTFALQAAAVRPRGSTFLRPRLWSPTVGRVTGSRRQVMDF